MRVWIIGSKRHADSNEERWIVFVPHWDGTQDPDSYWEHVADKAYAFSSESKAREFAKTAKSNVCDVAQIQHQTLEQIEGTFWDWDRSAPTTEVDCIFEEPK